MKKFIIKVIIFAVLFVISFVCLIVFNWFIIGSQFNHSYQASLIDKIARLESINEPKIILVGDSNVAFGFDSALIEQKIGMPVVNMGLHGAMGNMFHEGIAKLDINEGDIVVVCHSSFDDNGEIDDKTLVWITIDNHIDMLQILTKESFLKLYPAYPNYLRRSIVLWLTHSGNRDSEDSYSRKAFNKYGDVVYKPTSGQMDVRKYFEKNKIKIPQINDICINRLNEYNRYITERGAALVIAGYPIAYGEYSDFTADDFRQFQSELQSRGDCQVISDYTDYLFPYHYFYDTRLHLNSEGAKYRTELLIRDLEKIIMIQ